MRPTLLATLPWVLAAGLAAWPGCTASTPTVEDAAQAAKAAATAAEAASKSAAAAVASRIEQEVIDELVCSGKLQPATIARLKDALHGGKALGYTDLLESPDVVGPLMGVAGSGVGTALLIARNFSSLRKEGHVQALIEGGWQAPKCGEALPIQCLIGKATSTVKCAGASVDALEITYDKCSLDGPLRSGTLRLTPVTGQPLAAGLEFVGYQPSEAKKLAGRLRLQVGLGAGASLQLATDTTLTVTSILGTEGKKCAEVLTIHTLKLTADASQVALELNAAHTADGKTRTLRSTGSHLRWPVPPACACPQPGGGIDIGFAAPFGGVTVTLAVGFGAATTADTCAAMTATVAGWPVACKVTESAAKDCGKGALQKVATAVGSALCGKL